MEEGWVAVARLLRPQGRRGELLAEPLTDAPGVLVEGASLWRAPLTGAAPNASLPTVTVEKLWQPTGRNAGRIVLKLRGCEDISSAEAMAGQQLMVRAEAMPALEANNFYVRELLGCTLWDGDAAVGEIVDVQFAVTADGKRLEEAAPLLEVQPAGDTETVLVPFVRAYLVAVDVAEHRVAMRLPVGLVRGESDEATAGG